MIPLKKIMATIKDIPKNTRTQSWALYCHHRAPWTIEDEAVFLPKNPFEDEVPAQAKEMNLRRVLMADQVSDVLENAKQQFGDVSEQEILAALSFYAKKDAFIDLQQMRQTKS
jgi:hypothetical protein